jgi:hypothetical protein
MKDYLEQYVNFLKTQFNFESYEIVNNYVLLFDVTLLMDVKCSNGKIMKKDGKFDQIYIPVVFQFETIDGDNLGTYEY